jgi:hypothetical protein
MDFIYISFNVNIWFILCKCIINFSKRFIYISSFKKKILFKIKVDLSLFFFISYNIVRGFFSSDHFAAIQNSFSQFRFLFLALFIYLLIDNKENIKIMLTGWLILILFVCFDSIYQFFF